MCGIAGLFAYGANAPPIAQQALLAMRDQMLARGPDGAGSWVAEDQRIGLAHRRLAIIDLSDSAAQPMASESGASVLTFNGEIYNYRELRRGLEQNGVRFRTQSDTEVILSLYEREGIAMLPRLRGMFAFAIWDARRRGLLLARDPRASSRSIFPTTARGLPWPRRSRPWSREGSTPRPIRLAR